MKRLGRLRKLPVEDMAGDPTDGCSEIGVAIATVLTEAKCPTRCRSEIDRLLNEIRLPIGCSTVMEDVKTAIYLRVSTGGQSHDPQRQELLDFCARRGWGNVEEYADTISGAKFSRDGLDRLMSDVRRGRIERVVCVKLDRLGRSLPHLAQLIGELDAHRAALVCTSQAIDTSHDNPAGRLQMHVLMAVAEFERSLIRERTKAGVAAARARGRRLGRPRVELSAEQSRAVSEYRRIPSGGLRGLARQLGLSLGKTAALVKADAGALRSGEPSGGRSSR